MKIFSKSSIIIEDNVLISFVQLFEQPFEQHSVIIVILWNGKYCKEDLFVVFILTIEFGDVSTWALIWIQAWMLSLLLLTSLTNLRCNGVWSELLASSDGSEKKFLWNILVRSFALLDHRRPAVARSLITDENKDKYKFLVTRSKLEKDKIKVVWMVWFICDCQVTYLLTETHLKVVLSLYLIHDVETNPGPGSGLGLGGGNSGLIPVTDKDNLFICTYNVQGLLSYSKHKRVNKFLNTVSFKSNSVICLQETHFKLNNRMKYLWTYGHTQSYCNNGTGGTAILFNASYFDSILKEENDIFGRWSMLTVQKEERTYTVMNVYAPNDKIEALDFFNDIDVKLGENLCEFPLTNITLCGDFNVVLDPSTDSVNRKQTTQEENVVKKLKLIMVKYNLIDTFRVQNTWGGYTWGRNNPEIVRSRLDMILSNNSLVNDLAEVHVTKHPNESDHSFLYAGFTNITSIRGPGIIRCNASLMDHECNASILSENIKSVVHNTKGGFISQHVRWDYCKMKIREEYIKRGKSQAKVNTTRLYHTNIEIDLLETKINKLLAKANRTTDVTDIIKNIDNLKTAIEVAKESIDDLKNEESERLIFRSRAKWVEKGEKSNKYFLNLIKLNQRRSEIKKISVNGRTFVKPDDINKQIHEFYAKLYKDIPVNETSSDQFLTNLPKLDDIEREALDRPLTLEELTETLKTCDESAPGPDGLSYRIYKDHWEVLGPEVLLTWNESVRIGKTSPSQRTSVITLLEKKDKDKTIIENLRPISLSNCDIKICTKALALRTNLVLDKILINTQTGYVPGRNVANNSRLLSELIEKTKTSNTSRYVVTLDAKKAFDSVNHDYLIKCLIAYNFPETYISYVKMIYTDLIASVMVNGFTTDFFKILRSVKQGDALSCALFVIAIDPLLRTIETNEQIKPININGIIMPKSLSYADDITGLVRDVESVQELIKLYYKFAKISGIQLNVSKTEIMNVGYDYFISEKLVIEYEEVKYDIYTKETVVICGVAFGTNEDSTYTINVKQKIVKLERKLLMWRQRNLTQEGKVLIVKCHGLSQLTFIIVLSY